MIKGLWRKALSLVVAGALLTAGMPVNTKAAEAGTANVIENGASWYDNNGNLIQGHGGNMLTYNDTYYWVGEHKSSEDSNFHGVSLYSSKDLAQWTYLNDIITPGTKAPEYKELGIDAQTGEAKVSEYPTDTLDFCTIERPKLIYSKELNKFVLWAHWENGKNYSESLLLVATSDTIDGDYEVVKLFNPAGNRSLDFTIFVDEVNNQAYIISACGHTMYVYPLTSDYTDVDTENCYALFEDAGREAPALVKAGEYYVLLTSGQSGWYPNQTQYAYTKDISNKEGWSGLRYTGNNTTWYSQPTNIAVIKDAKGNDQYIYMGDRWNTAALDTSSYVWLPMDISTSDSGVEVALDYVGKWSLDVATGTIQRPEYELVSEGKSVKASSESSAAPAANAVDGIIINTRTWGDNSNFFQPSNVPYTWEVDLGDMYDLARMDISFRAYNGSEAYSQYTIEGSNDEKSWVKLADALSNKTVGFKSHEIDGNYRYVRINCKSVYNVHNNNAAAWAAGLVEVQVYADGLTSGYTVLEAYYNQYKDTQLGYYTEESYGLFQEALTAARELLQNTAAEDSAYRTAYQTLRDAVEGLTVTDGVPVEVTGSIGSIAVYVNQVPDLPDTIEAVTQGGDTIAAELDWSFVSAADFDTAYETVTVEGKVKQTDLTVSAAVEVIPENLIYYIDCNQTDSQAFAAVTRLTEVTNKTPDQAYHDTWGITGNGMTVHAKTGTNTDKKQTGYYGDNSSTGHLSYVLPLEEAGTYDICVASYEWWNGPRTMNIDAVYTNAAGEEISSTIIENLSVSSSSRSGEASGSITVDAPTTLYLNASISSGTEAPVLTFIGISRESGSEPSIPELVVKEGTADFTVPEYMENKTGVTFNSVIKVGSLEEEVKMVDAVLTVDKKLEVQEVTMDENLTGGELNWYVEEGEEHNTLRLVYSDLSGNTTLSTTEDMPYGMITVTYGLKEAFAEVTEDSKVTVTFAAMNQYPDSETGTAYVKEAISKAIQIRDSEEITVAAKVLYTGDGSDLIPDGEKAVKVVVTGIEEDYTGQIIFSYGEEKAVLYKSTDFTQRDNMAVYLMTVPSAVTQEELADAANYTVTEEKEQKLTIGDTNGDAVIDAQDALNEVSVWLRKTTPEKTSAFILTYNVNGDVKINSADALSVVEHFVSDKQWAVVSNH